MARTLKTKSEMPKIGGRVDAGALLRYVERVEVVESDIAQLSDDRKEIYKEAKSAGIVTAKLRQMVRERRMEPEERADAYAVEDVYRRALGMLADTPLGLAAMERKVAPIKPNRGQAAAMNVAELKPMPGVILMDDSYEDGKEAGLRGFNVTRMPPGLDEATQAEWMAGHAFGRANAGIAPDDPEPPAAA